MDEWTQSKDLCPPERVALVAAEGDQAVTYALKGKGRAKD